MLKHKFKITDYSEAVAFLESLSNISTVGEKRLSSARAEMRLKTIDAFLKILGQPEKKLKIIHIAGTSGKGSTVAMIHNILQAAGRKVGSYTSPHTTTFCERIKVGDIYIGERDLVGLVNYLKNKLDEYCNNFHGLRFLIHTFNFFDASFILALLYFKKIGCEYAVIETGLGGRYDSTNAIKKPIYTIITNIGRDHLDIIGPTLKDAAYEKAGIIKPRAPFLTGEINKRFIKIFAKECGIQNTECRTADYKKIKNIKIGLDGTNFEYKGEKYKLKLLGEHQARNAVLAIECAADLAISGAAVKKGLARAFYPARLEIMSERPFIIIDGAHNADKLRAAINFIKTLKYKNPGSRAKLATGRGIKTRYLIMAAAKNKEIKKIIPEFVKYFDKINFTRFSNPFRKCYSYSDWMKIIPVAGRKKIKYFHLANDALLDILPKLRNNDSLLITGSIFLAGELRKHWYPEEKIIKFRNPTKH